MQEIEQAVSDAGGPAPMRLRALKVPIDPTNFDGHLDGDLAQYKTAGLDALGREFAHELVNGGDTPAWDALTSQLVEEKAGSFRKPVDGVVVARTVKPQSGPTATFLSGVYAGLGDAAVPAVGVEPSGVSRSAVPSLDPGRECRPSTTSTRPRDGSRSHCSSPGGSAGNYGLKAGAEDGMVPPIERNRVADPSAVLVAARDEEGTIAKTVAALREQFPEAEVIVADDGSRDATAAEAERAGARVLELPRRGKGQALTLGEQAAPAGALVLADADLVGDLGPLARNGGDLTIAAFAERRGGGLGIARTTARKLIRARSAFEAREPLSGQRHLSAAARAETFPVAAGFGCEVRMTIDAARAGLSVSELVLPLSHKETGRDVSGFAHRGRQLVDTVLAAGPLAVNHRGLRLPVVGWTLALRRDPAVAAIAAIGLADDLWSGPERGFRRHLRAGRTTGVLKLVGIPLAGLLATRQISGALLVGLSANFLNQLDTRPGRALKAYLAGALVVGAPTRSAVFLLPYDLREKVMLGDAGSNALGAMLGLSSVSRLTGRSRWLAIGALAGLTLLGERRSLGALIERTPGLRTLDRLGRQA